MSQVLCPAVVLRHLDYGEDDRIVSFLTPDHGRISGFAPHARKSRKRFGAALELFASVTLSAQRRPRSELLRLESVELRRLRPGLASRLPAFALAGYAAELMELLLAEGQPQPELFQLLEALLDHLDAGGDVSVARLLFELRLVQCLGWAPHLGHCSRCNGPVGEPARFLADAGGALCAACAVPGALPVAAGTLGSLARCLRAPLTAFAEIRLGAVTLREGTTVLQQLLAHHWPRPPRSLPFLLEATAREP